MRASAAVEPVPRRPGAVGAREDRPRARGHGALRRAALRRLAEDALHAVPALHLADACTSCSATTAGSPARSRSARRGGRRSTTSSPATTRAGSGRGRRASCAPGQPLRGAGAALPQAPARDGGGGACAPRHRTVIDTHAHLDALDDDPADVVARAARGRRRRASSPSATAQAVARALELADAHDGVYAILGIHPHEAGATTGDLGEVRELLGPPEGGRGGGDRARLVPRLRAARGAARLVRSPARARRRAGEAGRDPHARRRRRHARGARRLRRHRRPPLLLVAAPARAGARARLVRLVRRQRDVPEGARPPPRGGAGPRRPHPRRDRLRRTSRRSRCAAAATSPPTSCTRLLRSRRRAARSRRRSSAQIERNADRSASRL